MFKGIVNMNKDPIRIISRLDIKSNKVVKGINLEGVRQVGEPKLLAEKYYNQGVDEILYMDVVASLYERNTIAKFIKQAAENIFVPLTVGGGIRNMQDIRNVLNNGADKVAINTAAIKNKELIRKASREIGSQSIIISIEAKKKGIETWEAYYDNGREKSGLDVIKWAKEAELLGAGELLITSIDKEGLCKGMDLHLLEILRSIISIPIIFSGGVGKKEHIVEASQYADAVALASILHYEKYQISEIKQLLKEEEINIREEIDI